jgi:hypothetical protein
VKTREILKRIESNPSTVFVVDLPEWRYGQQTGRRESVPAYVTGVERHPKGGYASLVAASTRSVPDHFPVQMILGVRGA